MLVSGCLLAFFALSQGGTSAPKLELGEQNRIDFTFSNYPVALPTSMIPERPTTEERLGNRSQPTLVRYFTLIMTVVYAGVGVYLWFAPEGAFNLPDTPRRLLAAVFVFYGIVRFVRTYQQHFKKNQDDAR